MHSFLCFALKFFGEGLRLFFKKAFPVASRRSAKRAFAAFCIGLLQLHEFLFFMFNMCSDLFNDLIGFILDIFFDTFKVIF